MSDEDRIVASDARTAVDYAEAQVKTGTAQGSTSGSGRPSAPDRGLVALSALMLGAATAAAMLTANA
ncbi:hypothetical protein JXD38_02260 [candidate division WOR-3 bacterium]|nr:hypothetical protein [candidate division WOR-3 bacterium]